MKKKDNIKKNILIGIVAIPAIGLLFRTRTPSIKGYKNSISTLKQVVINGTKHELMIRGNDRNNPVIIFVHGGPGCPETPYVRKYQDLLERDFTIVHYDERATGKSFHFFEDYSNLSIDLLVDDLIALTDYISRKLGTKQIILAGHSFGTIVGIKTAHKAPEKYLAYVGIGQIGDFWKGEIESFEYALEQATLRNNVQDIKEIEAYRKSVLDHKESFPRNFIRKYAGAVRLINEKSDMVAGILLNPEYNLVDAIRAGNGLVISDKVLWKEVKEDVNLPKDVSELEIPCYFAMGKYDYLTPAKTAKEYFDSINAPVKEFIVFDHSAHYPQFEEKQKFYDWIKKVYREIKQRNKL
ncbi:MAG: alpha/beta fold hydrolase [Ruminiclostridium sp.]